MLAGAGEDLHTGEQKTVRMDREDYAFLREQGREHGNYAFYHELDHALHDLDTHDTVGHESYKDVLAHVMDEQHAHGR